MRDFYRASYIIIFVVHINLLVVIVVYWIPLLLVSRPLPFSCLRWCRCSRLKPQVHLLKTWGCLTDEGCPALLYCSFLMMLVDVLHVRIASQSWRLYGFMSLIEVLWNLFTDLWPFIETPPPPRTPPTPIHPYRGPGDRGGMRSFHWGLLNDSFNDI